MKLSRRGFLGALATAAVGACVATKIPTSILPARVRTYAACEFLREKYNAWWMGRSGGYTDFSAPRPEMMLVGRELFQAYEGEIVALEAAFIDLRHRDFDILKFKGAGVMTHELASLRGWDVMILDAEQWERARALLRAGKSLEWVRNTDQRSGGLVGAQ